MLIIVWFVLKKELIVYNRPVRVVERTDRLSLIRSSSALPTPEPDSRPPTPTRLAGTGSSFEFEDRGDLIKFYNAVSISVVLWCSGQRSWNGVTLF